jgi:ferrous iron transport protein B
MLKSLLIHMWDRSKMFLRKMGGIILMGSIIIWALSTFPRIDDYSRDYAGEIDRIRIEYHQAASNADANYRKALAEERNRRIAEVRKAMAAEETQGSFLGKLGKAIAPVFEPIGINWQGGISLLTGFVAKEIVVSTMGVLYAVGPEEDGDALRKALLASGMSALSALAMMVFVLLYVPCLATVATIRRETGSMSWTLFSIGYTTLAAWVMAFLTYQGGRFLGFG